MGVTASPPTDLANRPGPMAADTAPTVDLTAAKDRVARAVTAALEPDGTQARRVGTPEHGYTVTEPTPLAGLRAAQRVIRLAEQQAHRYAAALRGDGRSWAELADLLGVPIDGQGTRKERAFDMVASPSSSRYGYATVYWRCGGPGGCGEYIADRGPFNGPPVDDEGSHAQDCRRLAAEMLAYQQRQEEEEHRYAVMERAYAGLTGFARETADRARQVRRDGGRYLGWSTSETLAVALVLNDPAGLNREGYTTKKAAIERVFNNNPERVKEAPAWIRRVRAAATGIQ